MFILKQTYVHSTIAVPLHLVRLTLTQLSLIIALANMDILETERSAGKKRDVEQLFHKENTTTYIQ